MRGVTYLLTAVMALYLTFHLGLAEGRNGGSCQVRDVQATNTQKIFVHTP